MKKIIYAISISFILYSQCFSSSLIGSGIISSTSVATLVSRWEFDSSLSDNETTGNNLTAGDETTYDTTNQQSGTGCISADGSNDYFYITDTNQTDLGGDDVSGFTIAFWYDWSTSDRLIHKYDGTDGWEIIIGGARDLTFKINDTSYTSATYAVNSGWAHYVLVFDQPNDTVRLYKNGIELTSGDFPDSSVTQTIAAHSGNFEIFRRYSNVGYSSGLMDDLRFYKGVLDETSVSNLYNSY